jgi:Domain of unknown function (DUF4384)
MAGRRTRRWGRTKAAAPALLAAACAGGRGASDPGTVVCSVGGTRPRIDCASEVKYEGVATSGGANVLNLGGASAKYEEVALRRINEHVERYVASQSRLCREYNACVIDAPAYHAEAKALRERLVGVGPAAAKIAGSSEGERKRLLSQLYVATVPPDARPEEFEVTLSVEAELPPDLAPARAAGRGPFLVRPNEPLPTDATLAFTFETSSEAYLYVFQSSAKTGVTLLFPDDRLGTRNPLPARAPKRVPDGAQRFRVNEKDVGAERVYVVASRRPLDDLQAAVARVRAGRVSEIAGDPALGKFASLDAGRSDCRARALELASAEPAECSRSRGLVLDDPEGAARASMTVRTDPGDDVIVKFFPFDHVTKERYRDARERFAAPTPEGRKARGVLLE